MRSNRIRQSEVDRDIYEETVDVLISRLQSYRTTDRRIRNRVPRLHLCHAGVSDWQPLLVRYS